MPKKKFRSPLFDSCRRAFICRQQIPLKRGDIIRVLPDKRNDRDLWRCIAVVIEVDLNFRTNGGYPYCMRMIDSPYDTEIWIEEYEVVGNVTECVHLLEHTPGRRSTSNRGTS